MRAFAHVLLEVCEPLLVFVKERGALGLFRRRDNVPSRNVFVTERFAADTQPTRTAAHTIRIIQSTTNRWRCTCRHGLDEDSDCDGDLSNPL